jgi:hypothetical protein
MMLLGPALARAITFTPIRRHPHWRAVLIIDNIDCR